MFAAEKISLLIAQLSNWYRLGDGLRSSHDPFRVAELVPWGLGFGLVALVGLVAHRLHCRHDMSRQCDDPYKLFRELCLVHQLDTSEQRLLKQLAGETYPSQPARVFVAPEIFAADRLPPPLASASGELHRLRERLFAS
jgi:hypothetical protein